MEGLFTTLNNKFKPQYNLTINKLQLHQLGRQMNENAEELNVRIILVALECNYKDIDRQLKKQFIHRLNDNDMLADIMKELTKAEERMAVTSEHELVLVKRVAAQGAQSTIITSLRETKELDKTKTIKGERDTI